jgi:zinc and cadmium transporter
MTLFAYLILFLSVIVSGSAVFLLKTNNRKNLKLVLAFSGAYLFAISVTHLIPEVYRSSNKSIGLYVLLGFFFQILLEFFSEGIEHGHVHIHKHGTDHNHAAFPFAIIISLSVHSFLEGMPLAINYGVVGPTLLTGIVLHNIPVAFALMSMFMESGVKKNTALVLLTVFALTAPLGALTSTYIGSSHLVLDMTQYFDKIMAVVIGIFLHISTTILFESSEDHRFNIYKMITILCGAGLALML